MIQPAATLDEQLRYLNLDYIRLNYYYSDIYCFLTSQIHGQQSGYLMPDIWKRWHAFDALFSSPAF
jgi:hypothetical protein